MDLPLLYGISLAGLIVFFTCRQVTILLATKCGHTFRRHLIYPLLLNRNRFTSSITRLDVMFLVIYLATNGVVLGFSVTTRSELAHRAAIASLVNTVPLFFGVRTNPLMSFVGVPLSKYYFAHHCFGRVAIAEALLHAGLSMANQTWSQSLSGYLVSRTPSKKPIC